MRRVQAAGILAQPCVAQLLTCLVMLSGVISCIAPASWCLNDNLWSLRSVCTGMALFGVLAFFTIVCFERGCVGCEAGFVDCIQLALDALRFRALNGADGRVVIIVVGVVVTLVATAGLLAAPYFIYSGLLRVSHAGLHALGTYVLDIAEADPTNADELLPATEVAVAEPESVVALQPRAVTEGSEAGEASVIAASDGGPLRPVSRAEGSRNRTSTPVPHRQVESQHSSEGGGLVQSDVVGSTVDTIASEMGVHSGSITLQPPQAETEDRQGETGLQTGSVAREAMEAATSASNRFSRASTPTPYARRRAVANERSRDGLP